MLRVHAPAAHIQRRAEKLLDAQLLETCRGADNVHDRVNRADFVEVHLLDGHAVNERFGLPQPPEYVRRSLGNRALQPGPLNQLKDFVQRSMPLRIGRLDFDLRRAESPSNNFFG